VVNSPPPGHFILRKGTRYTSYRRLSGPLERSGRVGKILPSPGLDPRTVQPEASRYIDYAVLVHKGTLNLPKIRYQEHNPEIRNGCITLSERVGNVIEVLD